jgi:hypothetical protein
MNIATIDHFTLYMSHHGNLWYGISIFSQNEKMIVYNTTNFLQLNDIFLSFAIRWWNNMNLTTHNMLVAYVLHNWYLVTKPKMCCDVLKLDC